MHGVFSQLKTSLRAFDKNVRQEPMTIKLLDDACALCTCISPTIAVIEIKIEEQINIKAITVQLLSSEMKHQSSISFNKSHEHMFDD